MSSAQHTPANPETHTCGMCGYTWRHGLHGGHDCATRLKAQRDELVDVQRWAVKELEQLDEANAQMVAVTLRAALAKHAGSAL